MKKSDNSVRVEFVEDLFGAGGDLFAAMLREATGSAAPRIFLVADANVVQRQAGLGAAIGRWVKANAFELAGSPVILPGGERIKCDGLQSVRMLAGAAVEAKVGVSDVLLAVGGGAVLDVAGYVAPQVRGGLKLVRVPTTVSALLDASFAETAFLDGENVKDALGVRSVPALSVIDTSFTSTVLDGVWRAGFAEALRYAVVRDAKLVKRLCELAPSYRERDMAALKEIVEAVVASRQKKGGTDFALWSALRLQAISTYKLPHGHAVAIALAIDLQLATALGLLKESDRDLLLTALTASGAGEAIPHNRHLLGYEDSLLRGIDAWKLSRFDGKLVLPSAIGKEALVDFPDPGTIKTVLNLIK